MKEYSNGEITIIWKPELCIHAGACVHLLPKVYNPSERHRRRTDFTNREMPLGRFDV